MAFTMRSQALTGTPLNGSSRQAAPVARRGATPVRAIQTEPSSKKVPDDVLSYAKSLPGISQPFPKLFDPLDLLGNAAGTRNGVNEVKRWRESEVTHGRVAMLASLGFITQEQILGANAPRPFPHVSVMPFKIAIQACSVSEYVLKDMRMILGNALKVTVVCRPAINHFQQVEQQGAIFWEPLLLIIALSEAYRVSVGWKNPTGGGIQQLEEDYEPGELGFDPLGLYPKDPKNQYIIKTKELNNGRLAMIAIAAFVAQELRVEVPIFEHLNLFGTSNT